MQSTESQKNRFDFKQTANLQTLTLHIFTSCRKNYYSMFIFHEFPDSTIKQLFKIYLVAKPIVLCKYMVIADVCENVISRRFTIRKPTNLV